MSATQHTDSYWTNRFGGRFTCEEHALQDEKRRESRPWRIQRVIGYPVGETREAILPAAVHAIDDTKAPYTGQPDGIAPVWLFADLVAHYQALLAKYGPLGGYTRHHCGMGNYTEEIAVIEANPNHVT